jgi:hypothetical protein
MAAHKQRSEVKQYYPGSSAVQHLTVYPGFLVSLLLQREYGGWRRHGRYIKSKLQKTAFLIVVETLDDPPEHTHILIHQSTHTS